jgi:hypothetical protein
MEGAMEGQVSWVIGQAVSLPHRVDGRRQHGRGFRRAHPRCGPSPGRIQLDAGKGARNRRSRCGVAESPQDLARRQTSCSRRSRTTAHSRTWRNRECHVPVGALRGTASRARCDSRAMVGRGREARPLNGCRGRRVSHSTFSDRLPPRRRRPTGRRRRPLDVRRTGRFAACRPPSPTLAVRRS